MADKTSKRSAGILAPVFALRREGDLGIGDTRALRELMDWAAGNGIGFVQLLPINETGPDNSPYNAISSVALDPVLVEVSAETIPELTAADIEPVVAAEPEAALRGPLVDYPTARRVKAGLMRLAFDRFSTSGTAERKAGFAAFQNAEAAWLKDYCVFRTLIDRHGHELWDQWPADARGSVDADGPEATYHAWAQWVAFTQWRGLREHGSQIGVRLMGDIPIGVNYYSADVFAQTHLFDLEWSGGAPPERIFKDDLFVQKWGQNWGIPLYRWDVMEQDGYAWWRRRIEKLTDVFHIFRIDHVLGFYRIYSFPWRPQRNAEFLPLSEDEARARTGGRLPHFKEHDDDTPEHCAANRAAGDKYIRVVQSAAGDAEVVGEDLGSVPDYVRPHLLERGIPGFKIPQWEVGGGDHAISGADYPECSFTTYATHDHPPMRALWDGCRHRMVHDADEGERWKAGRELRLLSEFCGRHGADYPPYDDTIKWQMMRGLLASRSRYAACMITDLFNMEDRFNVPGVVSDANWRTRLPFTVRQLHEDPRLAGETEKFHEMARETGRSMS
jgi:4-alpha-glucanotransferase